MLYCDLTLTQIIRERGLCKMKMALLRPTEIEQIIKLLWHIWKEAQCRYVSDVTLCNLLAKIQIQTRFNTEARSKHGDNTIKETFRFQLYMTCKMSHSEGNERIILQSKSDDSFHGATAP
jgi:hypothetical protein